MARTRLGRRTCGLSSDQMTMGAQGTRAANGRQQLVNMRRAMWSPRLRRSCQHWIPGRFSRLPTRVTFGRYDYDIVPLHARPFARHLNRMVRVVPAVGNIVALVDISDLAAVFCFSHQDVDARSLCLGTPTNLC